MPAILQDGRVVLAWVDRYRTGSIRARFSASLEAPFERDTEVVLYEHPAGPDPTPAATAADGRTPTGETLADMSVWTYGTPYATALPDGDVLVVFYAGIVGAIGIGWSRLRITN